MALIIPGVSIASASGSSGGTTFSRNRYGMYIRNRSVPVNPNSSRQQAIRSQFSDVANQWDAVLTAVQRQGWNEFGANVPMKNALGQTIYLTGFSHFLRSNVPRLQAGLAIVLTAPVIFVLPESDSTMAGAVSAGTQLISVSFDTARAWVDEDDAMLTILMSMPRGVGRDYIDGPFRYAGVIEGDSTTPPTSPQTIACPFIVAADQGLIVRARIGRADGRLSEPFLDTVQVGA